MDINEWGMTFMVAIIVLGIAVALRYIEHWVAAVGITIGWATMAFWCFPSDSSVDYEDFEILLIATNAAFSHFMAAYKIKINLEL